MDQRALVTKLREISDIIIKERGDVNLLMLFGNNTRDLTTAFDYIVSAVWLDDFDPSSGIDIILDYLYENLTEEELAGVSRVSLIHTNDFMISDFTKKIGVKGSITVFTNCLVGDLEIPYAIVFESIAKQ